MWYDVQCALAVLCLSVGAVWAADPVDFGEYALSQEGNAVAGKAVFNAPTSLCATCHSIDGSASKLGPDLGTIGNKFEKHELIRSVIEPGATVAVGYGTTVVELTDGSSRAGVVQSITRDSVHLIGVDNVKVAIARKDIASQRTEAISLMPPGLHLAMEPQGFADLIAYLGTLRAKFTDAHAGSPATIPLSMVQARMEPMFNLSFDHPALFDWVPGTEDGAGLVVGYAGKIWAVDGIGKTATRRLFLDLSGKVIPSGSTGLLGLAFHPDFEKNRRYLLQYQVTEDGTTFTIIDERKMKPDRVEDSGEPAREIIKIRAATLDHCGGDIRLGKDGYLYFGMGDTGPHRDPQGHAQDMGLLLGKILRIDVDKRDGELGYAIPADNPFVGKEGSRGEIWAYGFRNPYRFSWDRGTGDLWVADLGQDRFDEVAIVRRGENHGWNVFEGHHPFSDQYHRDGEDFVSPVISYGRHHGVSVTGGQVYRGSRAPALQGWYIFGDYQSRRIWALRQRDRKLEDVVEIARAPSRITAFTASEDGEIAVTCFDDGKIYRLILDGVDPEK